MTEPARDTILDLLVASLRARPSPLTGRRGRPRSCGPTRSARGSPWSILLLESIEEALVLGGYDPGAAHGSGARGGTIVVGPLNLGGSMETIPDPVAVAELAVDRPAARRVVATSRASGIMRRLCGPR